MPLQKRARQNPRSPPLRFFHTLCYPMLMREYPWHQRKALLKHHRWFSNLVDFHAITKAWMQENKIDPTGASYLTEDLKMLESQSDVRLEQLLDDTAPEDLLARLEAAVLGAQTWAYRNLFSRLNSGKEAAQGADALRSVLEQTTWKQGKHLAEGRWNRIRPESRNDLRAIFLTLIDSPVALSFGENAFLLKRGLPDSVDFEFRACPHRLMITEDSREQDALCSLQSAWIRGYLYGMNNLAQLEYTPAKGPESCCSHHWNFGTHGSVGPVV